MDNNDIEDIGDIDIETTAAEDVWNVENDEPKHKDVTAKNREIFELLICQPETKEHLDKVAASTAWRFQQEKDDVEQQLCLTILNELDTLQDIKFFKSWAFSLARHRSLNDVRRRKVERKYLEKKAREVKESTSHNREPLVQSSAIPTPEEELLQKEGELLQRKRDLLVRETVLGVMRQYPKWLTDSWDFEKLPRENIRKIIKSGKAPATVYRKVKEMQKEIDEALRAIGIRPYGY